MGNSAASQHDRNQADPRWLEWVAPERMDAEIARLLAEVPGMPEDPWTFEALEHVGRFAIDRFATTAEIMSDEDNWPLADRIARYFGEVFHRLFESKWENRPEEYANIARYPDFGPTVTNEWTPVPLAVGTILTAIIHDQSTRRLSIIWRWRVKHYPEWVTAGRPPRIEYLLT